MADMTLNDL